MCARGTWRETPQEQRDTNLEQLFHDFMASLLAYGRNQRPEDALAWFGTHSQIPREYPGLALVAHYLNCAGSLCYKATIWRKIKLRTRWMHLLKYGAMRGNGQARALGILLWLRRTKSCLSDGRNTDK